MSIRHRVAAYRALCKRYREVFSYFWRERENLGGGLFNEQEAAFLPAALALQEQPLSATARLTGRILMGLVCVALLWSVLGKMDIIVNATGKVIPSDRTKSIASVDVAVVRDLRVQEGQTVEEGELLLELDSTATDAERKKALDSTEEAALQMARSRAMIEAVNSLKPPKLPKIEGIRPDRWQVAAQHVQGQYQEFRTKLTRLDGEITRYTQALPLVTQRAHDYEVLARDHDVSTHAWLEKEQARIDLVGQLTEAKNQRAALIAQTRKEAQDALVESSKIGRASMQDAWRTGEHSDLLKLTAPIAGTVQQLAVHTVGGVVPAAQPLMLIVPTEQRVEVEAFLENKDIGFVLEGQKAEVKIDAFDYTKYGTMAAQVTHVSRDAIQDEKKGLIYSVKVALDKATLVVEDKVVAPSAGMSVNVEIKTGERRIIEYILSPLIQHQREALHER
ncbi:MAG: HlyD family type I secretion periplasmic adaptor subunit [Magnetococcales bacterium]|nr:HlyD family type I secretion periplasmic adaptor subunit [Magnetococcales bacterium]